MAGKKTPEPEQFDRELAVIELRRTGETWERIAKIVGFAGASGALKAYRRAMTRTLKQPTDELREIELDRLDRLQRGIWERAKDGDIRAIDSVLRIIDRRARLLGLDAPQKIQAEVVNYDGATNLDTQIERIIRIVEQVDLGEPLPLEERVSTEGTTTA
jgi:hypothetical protein